MSWRPQPLNRVHPLHKTVWCHFYWRSHGCRHGSTCGFAHHIQEYNGIRDEWVEYYIKKGWPWKVRDDTRPAHPGPGPVDAPQQPPRGAHPGPGARLANHQQGVEPKVSYLLELPRPSAPAHPPDHFLQTPALVGLADSPAQPPYHGVDHQGVAADPRGQQPQADGADDRQPEGPPADVADDLRTGAA